MGREQELTDETWVRFEKATIRRLERISEASKSCSNPPRSRTPHTRAFA